MLGLDCCGRVLLTANLNKYNNKMEQSKSPKSLAYARLGKPNSGKSSVQEEHIKAKRNSTGNIYEEMLEQIPQGATNYIRDLVHKNQKAASQPQNVDNFHSRRKSYAEIAIDSSSKEREKIEKVREERQTLCKPKYSTESLLLQQITPKNATLSINKRTSAPKNQSTFNLPGVAMINSYKKGPQQERTFLDHLNNYLQDLNETTSDIYIRGNEKLSQTLKINSGETQSVKLASKLQQCQLKVKQLKLKNYYQQKQLGKHLRKQAKMKESLFQMLGEIKHLTAQLSYQKKQRKKLERIIQNFELRRNKPERKTIGRHYQLKLQDFQNDMNTQNEFDKDYDSSFREFVKNTIDKRGNPIKKYGEERSGMLDSEKIEKMFQNQYSDDSDD